jgi:hypothetical protein
MVTELTAVTTSGKEVAVARSITPIQTRPNPVLSAIAHPYRDNFAPETRTRATQAANFIQIKSTDTNLGYRDFCGDHLDYANRRILSE